MESGHKGSCYSLMEMRIPWVYAKVCHQPSRTPDNWFHFLILQVSPISYEIRAMEDLNVLLKVLFCRLKKPWQHKATTLLTSRDKLESVTAFETSVVWAKSKLFYQIWCTLKELQKYPQKGGISDKKGRKKWSKTVVKCLNSCAAFVIAILFLAGCLIYWIHWIMIQSTEPLLRHLLLLLKILIILLQGDDCSWGLYHRLLLQGLEKNVGVLPAAFVHVYTSSFFAFILHYANVYHSCMPLSSRNASLEIKNRNSITRWDLIWRNANVCRGGQKSLFSVREDFRHLKEMRCGGNHFHVALWCD